MWFGQRLSDITYVQLAALLLQKHHASCLVANYLILTKRSVTLNFEVIFVSGYDVDMVNTLQVQREQTVRNIM